MGPEEGQLSINLLRAMAVSCKTLLPGQLQPLLRFLARVVTGQPTAVCSRWCAGPEAVLLHLRVNTHPPCILLALLGVKDVLRCLL